jgi:hypothetical protein
MAVVRCAVASRRGSKTELTKYIVMNVDNERRPEL